MEWIKAVMQAIDYIEENISDYELSAQKVAQHVNISQFYFQKGFAMLCGCSVSEYIRNRRLALAGSFLCRKGSKVIDAAMKFGYDSPDSFTKAFLRFHNVSPSAAAKGDVLLKTFAPLKINISLEGGYIMDYKIVKKESFKVLGAAKRFDYETCKEKIPKFWQEHFASGNGKYVCGMFGVNIDEQMGGKDFEYLIADIYNPEREVPDGFCVKTIPEFTWAVFSCDGPMPEAFRDVHKKIFSQWLPALKEYEFAAGYCIESYDDPKKYPNGVLSQNYHAEIWIPVKKTDGNKE